MSSDRRAAPGRWRLTVPALLAALTLPLAAGCGKKGEPLPPIRQIPAAPSDFEVVRRGDRLLVSLAYPQVTAGGTPLRLVSAVTAWQHLWPAPGGPGPLRLDERQFAGSARPVLVLEGAELDAAVVGSRVAFELPVPDPQAEIPGAERPAATLAVRARGAAREDSGFSDLLSVPLGPAPAPPHGIEAEGLERGVRVSWEYPQGAASPERDGATGDADGTAGEGGGGPGDEVEGGGVAGFNLYRRPAAERSWGEPVRSVGAGARQAVDGTARYGQRYIYAVSAVAQRRPVLVESAFAEEQEILYRDTFPPPAPTGVVALYQEGAGGEAGRIRVLWRGVDADDLAGYRVYRRGPDSQELAPVTGEPVAATEYVDRGVASGATYTYRVSAVDDEGNESEPSGPASAAVR